MSETTVKDIEHKLKNPVWRLKNLYRIRTKMKGYEGKAIKYTPNRVQREVYKAIEQRKHRIIVLKPRKLGMSTGVILYMLDQTLYTPNKVCRTIAHRRQSVGEIFNDIAGFAMRSMEDHYPWVLPPMERSTTNEIATKKNSRYSVDVEARGLTPSFLHFTEIAYIEDGAKLQDSLESLPATAQGIAESTANGKGNWFEKTFMKNWQLLQAGEEPVWYPMFFPWYEDPNSRLPYTSSKALFFPQEIEELKGRFPQLTMDQLLWWDRKKYSLEDPSRMSELYPSSAEEAFIFSTGLVYGDYFRKEINVIPPMVFNTNYEITMDWGQTNPCTFLAIHQTQDDMYVVFREFYKSEATFDEMRNWMMHNVPEKMDDHGYFHVRFCDPSIFDKTKNKVSIKPGQRMQQKRHSVADELRMYAKIICNRGSQNDVQTGILRVKDYLRFDINTIHPFRTHKDGDAVYGSPRFFITSDCVNLEKEFGQYRWPKDPKGGLSAASYETPYKAHDHALDAIRYALLTWAKPVQRVMEEDPPPRTIAYYEKMRQWSEQMKIEDRAAF